MTDSISAYADAAADLKKVRRRRVLPGATRSDRLPPHSTENEQGIIGCILLSPNECMGECAEKLKQGMEVFYELRHQIIYTVLAEMYEARAEIDLITVQQRLKDRQLLEGVGGIPYLASLPECVPSAANLSYYLDIVQEKFLLRKMIQTCTAVVGRVYDYEGEVPALLDEVERDILSIRPGHNQITSLTKLLNEAQANIEDRRNNPGKIFGLSTGLMDLDRLTDGMHKSEMITVCALPSCGKTALAVGAVVHNAIRGIPGMILTAEMRPVQIITRSICSEARVNFRKILDEDFEKMTKSVKVLNKAPLHIIQVSGMSINQVRAIARRLKQRHDVQCGMIDYIQLLSGDGDNKEGQVSSISKGIKALCMELEIPILALSQLTEKATGGFTTKYATAIGEDTDSLWRIRNDGDWKPEVQPVKLMVEKSRDGATGPVDLTFRKTITRFENAAQDEEQPNLKPAERTKRDDPYPD